MAIPVYVFTGFLDSGKTRFMQGTLEDDRFNAGEKTLLLVCEEGEVEYNNEDLCGNNITMITVDEEEKMNTDFLKYCIRQYTPKKIFIEMNGMWDYKWVFEWGQMDRLVLAQVITLVDGITFPVYLNNMKSIIGNMIKCTELVIFNRCSEEQDLPMFRRNLKALNSNVQMMFEHKDGRMIELGKDIPPYDLNAPIIDITDDDYGIWYMDAADDKDRYEGKTVRFTARIMKNRKLPKNFCVPGRKAMTCCAEDIRFIGFLCKYPELDNLKNGDWVTLTANMHYERRREYGGVGPVLYATEVVECAAPEDELVYFN